MTEADLTTADVREVFIKAALDEAARRLTATPAGAYEGTLLGLAPDEAARATEKAGARFDQWFGTVRIDALREATAAAADAVDAEAAWQEHQIAFAGPYLDARVLSGRVRAIADKLRSTGPAGRADSDLAETGSPTAWSPLPGGL